MRSNLSHLTATVSLCVALAVSACAQSGRSSRTITSGVLGLEFLRAHQSFSSSHTSAPIAATSNVHNFTTADFPGASGSLVFERSIAAGIVFGIFEYGTGGTNSFTLKGSRYASFNVPGSTATEAVGINSTGQIVGGYVDAANVEHGFLDTTGTFSNIDVPGATSTIAAEINNNGDVVGDFSDALGGPGFLDIAGNFTTLDFPGATFTERLGINFSDQVVGDYTDSSGHTHGYLYVGGVYTPIDFPLANSTLAIGINDSGAISGAFTDSGNVEHGFTYANGRFDQIDVPGANGTLITRIKNQGQLAGAYTDALTESHGIIAPH